MVFYHGGVAHAVDDDKTIINRVPAVSSASILNKGGVGVLNEKFRHSAFKIKKLK